MATTAVELTYVENDTLPALECTYTGIDITGFTITLHISYETPLVVDATLTEPVDGLFKFNFIVGDLRKGKWCAEIQIKDTDDEIITFQGLKLIVVPQIA